jgi:hypothetical protein
VSYGFAIITLHWEFILLNWWRLVYSPPRRRIEESIKLHDPNRQLPARPSAHTATGNKSWFASVTAGLQRESLTLQELDLLGWYPAI